MIEARPLSKSSYPTRVRVIIVKYACFGFKIELNKVFLVQFYSFCGFATVIKCLVIRNNRMDKTKAVLALLDKIRTCFEVLTQTCSCVKGV